MAHHSHHSHSHIHYYGGYRYGYGSDDDFIAEIVILIVVIFLLLGYEIVSRANRIDEEKIIWNNGYHIVDNGAWVYHSGECPECFEEEFWYECEKCGYTFEAHIKFHTGSDKQYWPRH